MSMHLRNRGTGERPRVDELEHVLQGPPEAGSNFLSDRLVRHRLGAVEAALELLNICLWKEGRRRSDELAQFDVGGAKIFE